MVLGICIYICVGGSSIRKGMYFWVWVIFTGFLIFLFLGFGIALVILRNANAAISCISGVHQSSSSAVIARTNKYRARRRDVVLT